MQGICDPSGWLTDSVIDAYLMIVAENAHRQSKRSISAYFLDTIVTRVIAERPAKDPFKPSGSNNASTSLEKAYKRGLLF
jgi:hypothetical protein